MTIKRTTSSEIAQLHTESNQKLPWDSQKHQVQTEQITGRLYGCCKDGKDLFSAKIQQSWSMTIKSSSRPKLQMLCPPPPPLCCQLAINYGDSTGEVLEIGSTKGFTSQRMQHTQKRKKKGEGAVCVTERMRCLSSCKDSPWFQHALNKLSKLNTQTTLNCLTKSLFHSPHLFSILRCYRFLCIFIIIHISKLFHESM